MTVHNAKGLEFGVVAVPDLSRGLLAGTRPPLLALGREESPRVGLQLRRLGAGSVNLFDYAELCEEAKRRDSEEGLRLFHVAATRARKRLILSGVVRPEPARERRPGTAVIERLVEALGIERDRDATAAVPPPQPRPGLEASFPPSEVAVRANLPSPERAAELRSSSFRIAERSTTAGGGDASREVSASAREERAARGAVVHALLEWCQANGWSEPSAELARRHARAAGFDPDTADAGSLLAPVRGWLGSPLLRELTTTGASRTRARWLVPGGTRIPVQDPAHDLRPRRRRGARRRAGRGRLRLPRAPRRARPFPPRTSRDGGGARAPGGRNRPDWGRRVPGRGGKGAQLGPLPRLPGPWSPLLGASGLGGGVQPRRQLVELQLAQTLAHRVQLGGAVGDQFAPLTAELERLAQAGLAGVEPVDDLLQPLNRDLVAIRFLAQSPP